jgi:hypothetical protein
MTADRRPAVASAIPLSPEATRFAQSEQAKRIGEACDSLYDVFYNEVGDHSRVENRGFFHTAVEDMKKRLDTVVGLLGGPIPATTDMGRGIEWRIDPALSSTGGLIAIDAQILPDAGPKTQIFMNGDRYDKRFPVAVQFIDNLLAARVAGREFSEKDTRGAMKVCKTIFDALVEPYEEAFGLKPRVITPDDPKERMRLKSKKLEQILNSGHATVSNGNTPVFGEPESEATGTQRAGT